MGDQSRMFNEYYLLMIDKKGWKTLAQKQIGLRTEYLRVQTDLPEVDVPKGTLVTIDPDCKDEIGGYSAVVVCLDHFDDQDNYFEQIKLTVIFKELLRVEREVYQILKSIGPADRYRIMTEGDRYPVIGAQIGDTVYVRRNSDCSIGIIQYIGPVEGLGKDSVYFGVELVDGCLGNSDGTLGQRRYFQAEPFSALFTTADKLSLYNEQDDLDLIKMRLTSVNAKIQSVYQKKGSAKETSASSKLRLEIRPRTSLYSQTYSSLYCKSSLPRSRTTDEKLSNRDDVIATERSHTIERDRFPKESSSSGAPLRNRQAFTSVDNHRREDGRQSSSGSNLQLGDRIVWLSDDLGPQFGTVRWIGYEARVSKTVSVGVELDNSVGSGTGVANGKRLFTTRKDHAAILPIDVLMKESDFITSSPASEWVEDLAPRDAEDWNSPHLDRPVRAVDELETRKLSPQAQFKRNRSQRQVDASENRKLRAPFVDDDNATSLSSNEINWSSGKTSPSSRERSLEPGRALPKKLSPDLIQKYEQFPKPLVPAEVSSESRQRVRDPYASEHFTITAEVHPVSSPVIDRSLKPIDRLLEVEDLCELLPEFDRIESNVRSQSSIEIGTLVELHLLGHPLFGVVRWIGHLDPDRFTKMAGIELEEEHRGAGDGWHNGVHKFSCPPNRGVFVPFTHFKKDSRFGEPHTAPTSVSLDLKNSQMKPGGDISGLFGDVDCPVVPGAQAPIPSESLSLICGRNKGIQGHQNSCYLDATLFAMFSFTSVFDSLLFRPSNDTDIAKYCEVQRVLREEIVNPLRKNYFVRADKVMKLRELLDMLTSVRGLTSEEKDPEEFLNSLLTQTLRASPFLELSSGQTSHLFQLFVERDESRMMPTVQELFEQSFLNSQVKLKKVPSVMILQMPRFGRQFKVYNRIIPSLLLDVTDIIEDSPRQCIVCGKLASYECPECFGEHSDGLDGTAFCEICLGRLHHHHKRQKHKWSKLRVPQEYLDSCFVSNDTGASRRLFMELFAVVCIETSHYVSFVKCGLGPDAPWCFFDSMADRKGEQFGYNIPEVSKVSRMSHWLSEEGSKLLNDCPDDRQLPEQVRRLICDAYMCFYQSPDVMMYQ